MLGVLACSRALRVMCLRAHVLGVFACLRACVLVVLCVFACLRAYVLGVLACLRATMLGMLACLTCLHAWRAYVLPCLVCLRACVVVMMKCFIFLRVCVLDVLVFLICFTFQYLNLKNLTAKNFCAFLSWTYFLFTFWYQLIKLFETNLRKAGKLIDIWYSCSCSKVKSIFYNLYIHLLHYFLSDSLLLFDLLSVKLLIALTFQYHNIPW